MTKVPLILQPLVKYADFQGRARRSEFWLWILLRFVLDGVLASGMIAMFATSLPLLEDNPEIFLRNVFVASPLLTLVNLGLLIPTLAVAVRRLHDTNRSGWWLVLPHVVAFIGFIAFMVFFGMSLFQKISANNGDLSETEAFSLIFSNLATLFVCFVVPSIISWLVPLVFYLTEGTTVANRFGNDPKGRGEIDTGVAMRAADAPEEMY